MEKQIEKRFCKYIADQGGLCLKLQLLTAMGFPDRTVLLDGRVTFIEFKNGNKGRLMPLQGMWLRKLQSMGFAAGVAKTFEEAVELLTSPGN